MSCNCEGNEAKKDKDSKVRKEAKLAKHKDRKDGNVKDSDSACCSKDTKDAGTSHDDKDLKVTKSSTAVWYDQKISTHVIPVESLKTDNKENKSSTHVIPSESLKDYNKEKKSLTLVIPMESLKDVKKEIKKSRHVISIESLKGDNKEKCVENKADKFMDLDESDIDDKDSVENVVKVHNYGRTSIYGSELLLQIRSSVSHDFQTFTVKGFIYSFNSIAKIIACLSYILSAVLFYKQPEYDTTFYQFYGTIPWYVMLPVLDIFCGVNIVLVYIGMLILLMKKKILYMIILDIAMSCAMAVMLLVSILMILDENNLMALYVQRIAAAVALVAVGFHVLSGFLTVIYYHPNKQQRDFTSSERIIKEYAIITHFRNYFK